MDDNILPEAERPVVFRKLQEVFDVCDEDCDGWIRLEHFVDLGSQFGRGEEVKKLAEQLDPHSNGRINFMDFCHGVFSISGYEQNLQFLPGTQWVNQQQCMLDTNHNYREIPDIKTKSEMYSSPELQQWFGGGPLSLRPCSSQRLGTALLNTHNGDFHHEVAVFN